MCECAGPAAVFLIATLGMVFLHEAREGERIRLRHCDARIRDVIKENEDLQTRVYSTDAWLWMAEECVNEQELLRPQRRFNVWSQCPVNGDVVLAKLTEMNRRVEAVRRLADSIQQVATDMSEKGIDELWIFA